MSAVPQLLAANEAFAAVYDGTGLKALPRHPVLVLTCFDARLHPERFLGLGIGDAHVLRNAGGRVTDDALRSMIVSSWLLGTREFLVIHHTDCGMATFTDDVLIQRVKEASGGDVSGIDFLTFTDLDRSVREDVDLIRAQGCRLPDDVTVSGYVYDVVGGALRPVTEA